jgi:hypothetical protein
MSKQQYDNLPLNFVKQATQGVNSIMDMLSGAGHGIADKWEHLDPNIRNAIIGTGAGAGLGGIASALGIGDSTLKNMLAGGLIGGGAGYGFNAGKDMLDRHMHPNKVQGSDDIMAGKKVQGSDDIMAGKKVLMAGKKALMTEGAGKSGAGVLGAAGAVKPGITNLPNNPERNPFEKGYGASWLKSPERNPFEEGYGASLLNSGGE